MAGSFRGPADASRDAAAIQTSGGGSALADTCKPLGVPSLASVADVTSCLARQVSCRSDEMLINETPRLGELLRAGGVSLP